MLKNYSYIPKMIGSFAVSVVFWTLFGLVLNLVFYFSFANDKVWARCDLHQSFSSSCARSFLETFMFIIGFPFLFLLFGKMWGVSKVIKILFKKHNGDLVALVRPLILKSVHKLNQKVGVESFEKVKQLNERIDTDAPWFVRFIFKNLKGELGQQIASGELNLKSESDVDGVVREKLQNFVNLRRLKVKRIGIALFLVNLGVLATACFI